MRARQRQARAQTESVERCVTGPVRGRRTIGGGGAARIGGPGWLEVSRRAVVTAAQNQITVKDQTIVQVPRSSAFPRSGTKKRVKPLPPSTLRRALVRLRIWWHVYPLGFLDAERASCRAGRAAPPPAARAGRLVRPPARAGLQRAPLGPARAESRLRHRDHFRLDPRLGSEDDLVARSTAKAYACC